MCNLHFHFETFLLKLLEINQSDAALPNAFVGNAGIFCRINLI